MWMTVRWVSIFESFVLQSDQQYPLHNLDLPYAFPLTHSHCFSLLLLCLLWCSKFDYLGFDSFYFSINLLLWAEGENPTPRQSYFSLKGKFQSWCPVFRSFSKPFRLRPKVSFQASNILSRSFKGQGFIRNHFCWALPISFFLFVFHVHFIDSLGNGQWVLMF